MPRTKQERLAAIARIADDVKRHPDRCMGCRSPGAPQREIVLMDLSGGTDECDGVVNVPMCERCLQTLHWKTQASIAKRS